VLLPFLTVALAVLGWHIYVKTRDISPFVLPAPLDVWSATVELLRNERTWMHAWVTVREILGGFAIAVVAGLLTGVVLGANRTAERAFSPFLVLLQVVPKVALIPLFILWFGFGVTAKVLVAAIFAYFPVAAATIVGVRSVSPLHRDLAFTVGASRRHRLVLVDLPSALPSILTGMEVAIVLATVGAVVAEYLAGSEGLGWLAVTSLNQLQVDTLFGVIVLMSILGFTLYKLVAGLRRLLVPWHPSGRDEPVTTAW
jgi:NitT/TauT family transport system permease protein